MGSYMTVPFVPECNSVENSSERSFVMKPHDFFSSPCFTMLCYKITNGTTQPLAIFTS
jgi:hypothetical protein